MDNFNEKKFEALYNKLKKEKRKPCLVWLYYSGHGYLNKLDQLTVAKCVDDEPYPLEHKMRLLSRLEDVHVVCIFDCCRIETYVPIQADLPEETKQTPRYTMTYACDDGKFAKA